MTQEFNEIFPSLKGKERARFVLGDNVVSFTYKEKPITSNLYSEQEIQANCLDKQIVQKDLDLLNQLISILQNHCGERGDNEGAVETLNRIIKERDERLDKKKVRDVISTIIKEPDSSKEELFKSGRLVAISELMKELGL